MKQKTKRLTLGEGEGQTNGVTHKHVLQSKENIEFESSDDGSITMMLKDIGILTHDEHDRMVIPAGKYRSYHQVEYNPMHGKTERVFD